MDAWNASVSFWDIAYFQALKKLLVSRRVPPVQAKNLLEVIDLDGNGKAVRFSVDVHFGAWWLVRPFLSWEIPLKIGWFCFRLAGNYPPWNWRKVSAPENLGAKGAVWAYFQGRLTAIIVLGRVIVYGVNLNSHFSRHCVNGACLETFSDSAFSWLNIKTNCWTVHSFSTIHDDDKGRCT